MQNANADTAAEATADHLLANLDQATPEAARAVELRAKRDGITLRKYEQVKALSAILGAEPGQDVNRHLGPFEAADLFRLQDAGIIEPKAGGDQDSRLGYWARADDLDPFDEADADPAGDWDQAAED